MQVVTYQTSRDNRIEICHDCAARFRAAGTWPKDKRGEEYATVYYGGHHGQCEVHNTNPGANSENYLKFLQLPESRKREIFQECDKHGLLIYDYVDEMAARKML